MRTNTDFNLVAAAFLQGFPTLDLGIDRRVGAPDRRVHVDARYRWELVDRREAEWRRKNDVPNFDVIHRNDKRTFSVPDGPDGD